MFDVSYSRRPTCPPGEKPEEQLLRKALRDPGDKQIYFSGYSSIHITTEGKSRESLIGTGELYYELQYQRVLPIIVEELRRPRNHIKKLSVDNTFAPEQVEELFAAISEGVNLEMLEISDRQLDDRAVRKLCAALVSPRCKLKSLVLRRNYCAAAEMQQLFDALSAGANLANLVIADNQLNDIAAEKLSVLLVSPGCKLKKLILQNNELTINGIEKLSSAVAAGANLEMLEISGSQLDDTAIRRLFAALALPEAKLKEISLGAGWYGTPPITEGGARNILAALEKNKTLEKISLEGVVCPLKDQIEAKLAANKAEREAVAKGDATETGPIIRAPSQKQAAVLPPPPPVVSAARAVGVEPSATKPAVKAATKPASATPSQKQAVVPPAVTPSSVVNTVRHEEPSAPRLNGSAPSSSQQPQFSASTAATLQKLADSALSTLAGASPETMAYLKKHGDNGAQAESEFAYIQANLHLRSYYEHFNRSVSSAVSACGVIYSRMVPDDRSTNGEAFLRLANSAAQASAIPGASLITGMVAFMAGMVNNHTRRTMVNNVSARFPTPQHHAFIEMLARKLTLEQEGEITVVSNQPRNGVFDRANAAVRWLQADDANTPVKVLAAGQAGMLLDRMMQTLEEKAVQAKDIPELACWATGKQHSPAGVPNLAGKLPPPKPPKPKKPTVVEDTAKATEVEALRQDVARERALREASDRRLHALEERMRQLPPQSLTVPVGDGRQIQLLIGREKEGTSQETPVSIAKQVAYQEGVIRSVIDELRVVKEDVAGILPRGSYSHYERQKGGSNRRIS